MTPAEKKAARIAHLEGIGFIVQGCEGCRCWYESPTGDAFAPKHLNSRNCGDVKPRPHCTCDACF